MTRPIDVNVTLKGGLFEKDIPRVVKKQIMHEVLGKLEERTKRQGKGLGAQRNHISHERRGLELIVRSTLINPRVKGTAWVRKNVGIVRGMAPRLVNKTAQRIAEELG